MVAWEKDARRQPVVEAHGEFRMPVLTQGRSSELYKGDELYWESKRIAEGDPQLYEGTDYNIYSAVRLLENAFELGPSMRAGYVMTEPNWLGVVERNYL